MNAVTVIQKQRAKKYKPRSRKRVFRELCKGIAELPDRIRKLGKEDPEKLWRILDMALAQAMPDKYERCTPMEISINEKG